MSSYNSNPFSEGHMKKQILSAIVLPVALLLPTFASAGPVWYDIKFTGADIWTYSVDNAGQIPRIRRRPGAIVTSPLAPIPIA